MEIGAELASFQFSPMLYGEYDETPASGTSVTPDRPVLPPRPSRLDDRPANCGLDDYYRVTDGMGRPLATSGEWGVDF